MDAHSIDYDELDEMLEEHPYPLLFVTIGGDHLYGTVSANSDLQLRGVHAIPLDQLTAEGPDQDDVSLLDITGDTTVHIVTQDIATFNQMLLEGNGEAYEQLYSPLVVCTSAVHDLLKPIGKECISRQNARFYLQRASDYWMQFCEESSQSVETLLVVYQSLLSGIHLMKTGRVESNLAQLCQAANVKHAQQLIDEASRGGPIDAKYHEQEYRRLVAELDSVTAESECPEQADNVPALSQMLNFSRNYLPLEES